MKACSAGRQLCRGISGLLAVTGAAASALAQDVSATDEIDAVSTATLYEAHECHEHHSTDGSGDPQQMMQQFFDELGLTGQQQTDIQIITSDYAERFRDLARLGRTTAEELMSLSPDDPTYRDKTDEVSALAATSAAEMVVLMAEMRAKLHAVLTDQQRTTLREKIEQKKRELEEKKLQQQQDEESHDRPLEQFIG